MGWKDLPAELVHLILSKDSIGHHDLANLARVNSYLAGIVPQYLYYDVQFISAQPSLESECKGLARLAKFNRSITRNPSLAGLTRSIAIVTYVEGHHIVDCIWEVLAKLYVLEKLVLSIETEDKLHVVLRSNPLSRLRCVKIYGHLLNLGVAAGYMQLPAIESLAVEYHSFSRTGRQRSVVVRLPPNMERQTSLKELTIRVPSETISLLPRLISSCPTLTAFAFSIKNPINVRSERILLSNALSFCQETVTILELNCEYLEFWEYFDCCPVVLRDMKRLRVLKIDTLFLLSDDDTYSPVLRSDIHQRLPSSLEDLEILFQKKFGAFEADSLFSANDAPPDSSPTYIPEYLTWLLQIGMNKEIRLPNLVHVCIRESHVGYPGPYKMLNLPVEIEVPFRKAGIDIELFLLPSESRPF
ncbi:uncharacterized protein BDCG_03773 [Blastomyces dermatitidis ER-3]|uniref:F-box domain-containing protein n=1 Tax=Ajellomyces dermatitidis (strain ER-3 / ATCC MYA-2586) TaxID=559297 RepID=A0ABP2EXP9_AJEDR|nr:uncharacterized protein BDCG_03773 [Blastomyces dermatitidis ER-3]EEQ88653.2 hypothetical protein BDCG_03773 [Blastomyces dermatitidis ER-3]